MAFVGLVEVEALEGLESVRAIADDIIVWGKGATDEEAHKDHDRNLVALLHCCRERNIKLNKEKLKLRLKRMLIREIFE